MSKSSVISPACVSALLAALLLAAGCGGSEDSSEPAGTGEATGAASNGNGNSNGSGTAGSGSGDSAREGREAQPDSSAEAARTSFVNEAIDICTERRSEMLARVQAYVGENAGGGKGVPALQAEAVDPIFVPNMETQVEEIRELDPPSGQEEQVEAFLAAMEEGIETTKQKTYTAANVEELGSEYGRADRLADSLGVFNCAFGG